MRVISTLSFDDVRALFLRDHPLERAHEANTNSDAESLLRLADAVFGKWWEVRLSREEVRAVMLPWHLADGGRLELVPRSGLTVKDTADMVRERNAEFEAANPVCMAKLARFRNGAGGSVFLSTRAVPHDDYAELPAGSALYHLDGLHRLIAWELEGRLPADGLTAVVAGEPDRGDGW